MDLKCCNCKHYKGDCGHHYIDSDGHTDWNCHKETSCDQCGDCMFYEEARSDLDVAVAALRNSDMSDDLIDIIVSKIYGNKE